MIAIRETSEEDDDDDIYGPLYCVNPTAQIIFGFDSAYMGHTAGRRLSAVYDYDIAIAILAADRGISDGEAEDVLNEEIIAECVSQDSPLFMIPRFRQENR